MRIYTRKGDQGDTGVLGGGRVSKADARIRALGALDELNAALGLAPAEAALPTGVRDLVARTQQTLFEAGASLASSHAAAAGQLLTDETALLEREIDAMEAALRPLTRFILPGGSPGGAWLHWTRTVARRAESQLVEAVGRDPDRLPLLAWINRLSDALFVCARAANAHAQVEETHWESRTEKRKASD